MNSDQRIYFRNRLRQARNVVLNDAEDFVAVSREIERLGKYLRGGRGNGLKAIEPKINELAQRSPLAAELPQRYPQCHIVFSVLYELHRLARNDSIHEGASARSAAGHSVSLALVLEDALMPEEQQLELNHIMVREPVCASLWEPISFVRQTLLANSYSYLPVLSGEGADSRWGLVSDFAIARYLRSAKDEPERRERLAKPLGDAIDAEVGIRLDYPFTCGLHEPLERALAASEGRPILVVREDGNVLLGIATPFDML